MSKKTNKINTKYSCSICFKDFGNKKSLYEKHINKKKPCVPEKVELCKEITTNTNNNKNLLPLEELVKEEELIKEEELVKEEELHKEFDENILKLQEDEECNEKISPKIQFKEMLKKELEIELEHILQQISHEGVEEGISFEEKIKLKLEYKLIEILDNIQNKNTFQENFNSNMNLYLDKITQILENKENLNDIIKLIKQNKTLSKTNYKKNINFNIKHVAVNNDNSMNEINWGLINVLCSKYNDTIINDVDIYVIININNGLVQYESIKFDISKLKDNFKFKPNNYFAECIINCSRYALLKCFVNIQLEKINEEINNNTNININGVNVDTKLFENVHEETTEKLPKKEKLKKEKLPKKEKLKKEKK